MGNCTQEAVLPEKSEREGAAAVVSRSHVLPSVAVVEQWQTSDVFVVFQQYLLRVVKWWFVIVL
ncbi:hypothetical protein C0J52_18588 [Blattella germanica]|nr:hypothetical protein C0J52_18588 [Blattella germanica]